MNKAYGISSIGVAIPSLYLPLTELAGIRNISPDKYTTGLGCLNMALCAEQENATTLGIKAASRALENWRINGEERELGMIVTATETATDMSRPMASDIMRELNLDGNIRTFEVKHACYGGSVAIRAALEWQLSGSSNNKAALVVCQDVALYEPNHSGEPTQGAGAIAFIIDKATIAEIATKSYAYSASAYDFWRPVGDKYPSVNGRLSLLSYKTAVAKCFTQMSPIDRLRHQIEEFSALTFHVPFPKMVYKSFQNLCDKAGLENFADFYQDKIAKYMEWNIELGNTYTASLWFGVANALTKLSASEQLSAFSYGSGFGSELMTLQVVKNQKNAIWVTQLKDDLNNRQMITGQDYESLRAQS